MKIRIATVILCISVLIISNATSIMAENGTVTSSGKMSNLDFYRAVACEASPGGDCEIRIRKWPAAKRNNLTVAIQSVSPNFPEYKRKAVHNAIFQMTKQINEVGADLNLTFVSGGSADIQVFLLGIPEGGTVAGTGKSGLDGEWMPGISISGFNWRNDTGGINYAYIAISKDIDQSSIKNTILESLVRNLGFSTDIVNSYYNRRSVFSEEGYNLTKLRGQDALALLTQYPK